MLMIARPTVVFPHPDSPTRPSVSPRCNWNEMPLTASTSPTRRSSSPPNTGNLTTRFCTSSRVSLVIWNRRFPAVRIEMATHPVAGCVFDQRWFDVRTRLERVRTTGDKLAADGQVHDVGHRARDDREPMRFHAVDARNRSQQSVCVGMKRLAEQ